MGFLIRVQSWPGLEIATVYTVTNTTKTFSLATKNSGLIATLATN